MSISVKAKQAQVLLKEGQEALRLLLRKHSEASLWFFLTNILEHPQIECDEDISEGGCCERKNTFWEPLHRQWCDWAQNESIEFKGILAPRGHFKSTVISYARSVHLIVTNPNVRILLISALEENAENFAKQVKSAFQYNPRLAWVFPEFHRPPDKQFGNEHSFITPARQMMSLAAPTFTTAHLDAALASQHYDHIILDDPIEAKHVATEEQASKSKRSFNKILPLRDPSGERFKRSTMIVGTRWSFMDLYSGLITPPQGGVAQSTLFNWIVRSCLEDKDGKPDFEFGDPIFPTRWPRSELMKQLDICRNDPSYGESFWWNQYMNLCRAPSDAPFYEDWFVEVPSDTLPALIAKMIVVDTALKDDTVQKKGARGDYTVIMVVGWDGEGNLYLIDGLRSNNMLSKQFLDTMVAFAQKYNIATVVKQKVSEDTLGTQLRDAFAAVRIPLDYRPITVQGMGRKVTRIKDALQSPMQKNEIRWLKRLNPNNTWEHHRLLEQAKKELLNLGQFPTDDVADCLANCYHPDIKFRRQNLVGVGVNNWKIPGAPLPQLGNNNYHMWQKSMRERRGAGWSD